MYLLEYVKVHSAINDDIAKQGDFLAILLYPQHFNR